MNTELVTKDLTTTSLAIAELFGREHKSILRTIRIIIKDMSGDDLRQRKIALTSTRVKMPKGGFRDDDVFELGEEMTLIITGRLTGSEALKAQMKLADAFIAMRNLLKSGQVTMSQADREMLRISRIDTRTMKAISKTRNNAKVRENYQALVEIGILEELVEARKVTRYRFTTAGADYSNGYFYGIPRFEPVLHEKIIEVINGFKKCLEFQGDLFIERD